MAWLHDGLKEQYFDDPKLRILPDMGTQQPKYVKEKPNPIRILNTFSKRDPLQFINQWEKQNPDKEITASDYQKVGDGRCAIDINWRTKKEYL